jgi:hypothetical protein
MGRRPGKADRLWKRGGWVKRQELSVVVGDLSRVLRMMARDHCAKEG